MAKDTVDTGDGVLDPDLSSETPPKEQLDSKHPETISFIGPGRKRHNP